MSGAMARYPAAASASNWCRHEYQHSGKPWQRSTVGPLPASARCIRMPFVSINRCEIVIANLRKIIDLIANQSHCELQPQPKWLRRHPVERRTANTTCSTNLFSRPHRPSGSIGARSASGHGPKFSLGANLVGTTSDSRHRSQPRGFLSRANMRHGVVEAERQIKRPPTEAALLAPAMFTAFAFEHAHSLACARIQHLTNEPGHRIAGSFGGYSPVDCRLHSRTPCQIPSERP